MPFTIVFLTTHASPPILETDRQLRAAFVAGVGHPIGEDGVVKLTDGARFELGQGQVRLETLSPQLCRLVFDAARRTNTYLVTTGAGRPVLMAKGSAGKPPHGLGRALVVAGPTELCVQLQLGLDDWTRELRRLQAEDLLDAEEKPVEPSPAPGAGRPVAVDADGVVADCAKAITGQMKLLGWKITRVVVLDEPRWGVVWRADVATRDDPPIVTREVCWRRAAPHAGLMVSTHPLQMFDPKQNLEPLPAP